MSKVFEAKYYQGTLNDNIGGRSVTPVGSPKITIGEKGNAIRTGVGQYISYGTSMFPSGACTIVCWIKLNNNFNSATDVFYAINSAITPQNPVIMICGGGVGGNLLGVGFGTTNDRTWQHTFDHSWHCYIFCIAGSASADINNAALYIDNVLKTPYTTQTGSINLARTNSYYALVSKSTNKGDVDIAYLAVHDTVLTSKERENYQRMFNNLKPLTEPKRQFQLNKASDLSDKNNSFINTNELSAANSEFNTGNIWSNEDGFSITDGKLVLTSALTANKSTLTVITVGVKYRITYTVSDYVNGGVRVECGSSIGTTRLANGTYSEILTCTGNPNLILRAQGTTTLKCDTVSVQKITGLVAAYNMKPVGNTLVDISGNGKNGTLLNSVTSTSNGLLFNGRDSYVNLGDMTSVEGVYALTLMCRFKHIGTWGAREGLITKTALSGAVANAFELGKDINAFVSFYAGSNFAFLNLIGNGTPQSGIWNTLVATYNNSYIELFLNGISQGTSPLTGAINNIPQRLLIGSIDYTSGQNGFTFNGEISDARIYNRALSLKEIKNWHNSFVKQPYIVEDFSDASADGTTVVPNGFVKGSGSYKVGEFTKVMGNQLLSTDTWSGAGSSFVNNVLTITNVAVPLFGCYNSTLGTKHQYTQGKRLRYSFEYTNVISLSYYVQIRNAGAFVDYILPGNIISFSGTGRVSIEFTQKGAGDEIFLGFNGVTSTNSGVISNMSLVEIDPLPTFKNRTKYLENTVAGTLALPSNQAYGTWEFDWYKGTAGNELGVSILHYNTSYVWNAYYGFIVRNNSSVQMLKIGGILNNTILSYIQNFTWYRVKITRTQVGLFNMYIKGGAFGNNWTATSLAGVLTDNTYTTSNFFVIDLDAGDRFTNLVMTPGIEI